MKLFLLWLVRTQSFFLVAPASSRDDAFVNLIDASVCKGSQSYTRQPQP